MIETVGETVDHRIFEAVVMQDMQRFQNLPDRLLPDALKDANPYAAPRRIDGTLTLA